ncbi:MAG: peptidoglycan-binding domain-containing protein, partial [Hyphomicrobiaceae bacterium]
VTPPVPRRAERPALSTVNDIRAAVTARAPAPAVRTTVTGWQPVVANTDGTIKSGSVAASLRPKDPTSRYKLVVEIQRKLRKRGCYWGQIDGSWGAGSKYAMQAFVDRVNATLPIKQPDYVLLTLLQANSDKTCGACPAGQTATVGGSCVPQTTIAASQRKSGNGGQGGADVLPWKRAGAPQPAAQPLLRPVGTTIVTTAPLPGRMAIGGPMQQPPPAVEDDNLSSSVAAIAIEESNGTRVSPPVFTQARAARATPPKAKRSRRRSRGVRAARRHNLMLSLGGGY